MHEKRKAARLFSLGDLLKGKHGATKPGVLPIVDDALSGVKGLLTDTGVPILGNLLEKADKDKVDASEKEVEAEPVVDDGGEVGKEGADVSLNGPVGV
jgi:hypothetical protein